MKIGLEKRRPLAIAAGLVAAAGISIAIALALTKTPTIHVEGAELKKAADGSIQMITTLSLENVSFSGGVNMVLNFNDRYIRPSDYGTNKAFSSGNHDVYIDSTYQVPQELFDGDNPFFTEDDPNEPTYTHGIYLLEEEGQRSLLVMLQPKTVSADEKAEKGKIHYFNSSEADDVYQLYVDATEKTTLVQLSFRVDRTHLAEMVELFNGKKDTENGGVFGGKHLLQIDLESMDDKRMPPILPYWDPDDDYSNSFYFDTDLETVVAWEFSDTLVDAYSAQKEVTINAYEAYGNGTPLDLADALLRYSPTVRGEHILDGRLEDFTIYWGGNEGCEILTESGDKYRLIRTYNAVTGQPDGGHKVEKEVSGAWVAADDSWYSPKGGSYTISQLFHYDLGGGTGEQTYPDPIEVKLTVTPITVTDVTAKNLNKSYLQSDAPTRYDDLELPGTAQVVTDIIPGQVSLTMPIDSWVSTKAPTLTIAQDLSNLQGTDPTGATDVNWNDLGTYDFTAAPIYNEAVICRVYPWLTVNDSYTLEAVRRIRDTGSPEFEIYYGQTDDPTGLLTLKVAKKVDDKYEDMLPGDSFRLMLPNGTVVDKDWFLGTGGVFFVSGPNVETDATLGDVAGKQVYTITLQAGSPTAEPAKSGHELIRRSINLGGYFHVAVTEPGEPESEFVNRYVGPRANIYTRSYVAATAFDFTGPNAGLYPFYRNSVLPAFVTLPAGYTVETRYDANTGAERGRMNVFQVDAWNAVHAQNGSWNSLTSSWVASPAGSVIQVSYGWDGASGYDPFAATHTYTGFGTVTNPYGNLVQMNVEVQDRREPDPEERSVLLTYEEQGDAVLETPAGEVQRVIFDAKQVGYIYRQNVTLTLTNNGTEEIRGIYIDALGEDAHANDFIITQQPAPDLPAGASTTFTVSYVSNLEVGKHTAITTPIRIYSTTTGGEPLKTFEAEFTVTPEEVFRLYVVIDPADGSMGTAGPVTGLTTATPPGVDETPVSYSFPAQSDVWLLAKPKTDCSVARIYYMEGTTEVPLNAYPGVTTAGADDVLTTFKMPRHDMVVYVVFEESIYSRLRLIDIQDWSGAGDPVVSHQLPLMLHQNDGSVPGAAGTSYASVREDPDYDRTVPGVSTLIDPDKAIRLTEDEYLVVIPADADRSQVRLVLQDGLKPTVNIAVNYGMGLNVYHCVPGSPNAPLDYTRHTSTNFDSPDPGKQLRAKITLSHQGVERVYTLIIARRHDPDVPLTYPLNPGNSPYGMIMWDEAITDKDTAKAEYGKADRFAAGYIPVKATGLTLTYWTKAWGNVNYDRMDEALFVFAGEDFEDFGPVEGKVTNTAGDVVDNKDITRTLTGLLVPGSGATQKDRFENGTPMTNVLDLGMADVAAIDAGAWSGDEVRPGVYELQYSYIDFDGQTMVFARPLIVLSRRGDLDQSGVSIGVDAGLLEQRVIAPLGYEAVDYTDAPLFRSRVCDVNNDRNVNQIDANMIRGGFMGEFYRPVGYGK